MAILTVFLIVQSKAQEQELAVSIVKEEDAVRVDLPPTKGRALVLEVQRMLNEAPEWNPVLRVNSPESRRSYYDPMCRVQPTRFYRLRESADQGLPWADNFKLLDSGGTAHELYYYTHVPIIVLLTVGDSVDRLEPLLPKIESLRAEHGSDVFFWAIATGGVADREAIAARSAELAIDFPVLLDYGGVVTRNLNPTSYPEVFAARSTDWTFFYRGALSTSVTVGDQTVENRYLAEAIGQQLANEPIAVELAESVGEPVELPIADSISYTEDIIPILMANCVRCHSEGNIAPMAFDSYESVLENLFAIKDKVLAGEMPPWHADHYYGRFANESRIPLEDKQTLIDWINQGAERGEGEDLLLTAEFPEPTDWLLGEPDYVVEIPRQNIPSEGVVDYRYLTVENPIPEDVWLKGAAVIPGDATVVHHSLVFLITEPDDLFAVQGGLAGFYTGYVPGYDPVFFPEGTGKFLPAGSAFVFQMHYTTVGKATTDVTKLGLYLADRKPEMRLVTASAYTVNIDIPEGEANHEISATKAIEQDSWLIELNPHMHYRGKNVRYELEYPDGNREILLSVPDYHFDWQRSYLYEEPLLMPKGSKLHVKGAYDNSPQNRWNPDPGQRVFFGEQSWDEMFIGYFNYAVR